MKRYIVLVALALAGCSGGGGSSSNSIVPQTIATPVVPQVQRIAFIGDSITAGSRLPDNPNGIADPRSQSPTAYPFLVGSALQQPVTNLGIGGELIGSAVTDEVPNIPLDTHTVVVYLGTNNVIFGNPNNPIVTTASQQDDALFAAIRSRVPAACIVAIALPHPIYGTVMDADTDAFDTTLIARGYPTLDLRTQPWAIQPTSFIGDGVHPDAQGNADLAQSVERALLAANCI